MASSRIISWEKVHVKSSEQLSASDVNISNLNFTHSIKVTTNPPSGLDHLYFTVIAYVVSLNGKRLMVPGQGPFEFCGYLYLQL